MQPQLLDSWAYLYPFLKIGVSHEKVILENNEAVASGHTRSETGSSLLARTCDTHAVLAMHMQVHD